jgi:hypothetical protein
MSTQQPLDIRVENDELVIRIGVDTLAFAAQHSDLFNPFDPAQNDFVQQFKVINLSEFAKDVRRELRREEEDGSTLLTDLLDKVFSRVVDQGSEALHYADPV